MTMEAYTFGSDEGHAAVLAALPDKYEMSLNRRDMETLLYALREALFTRESESDADDSGTAEWLYSSIAETLGVELI